MIFGVMTVGEKDTRLLPLLCPYASALVVAPGCLILGWYWIALSACVIGMATVARYFWMLSIVTLPLLLLNLWEALLALLLIVIELNKSLRAGG